ncbi:hypothetical protein F66182_2670 [Fusarium sp. NRRL 66182]|nr:hypothetical protein F66182_2670 [Fusarium sp. NRRL 66182]
MASWLLDDSTLVLLAHGEEEPSPNKRRATTPGTPHSIGGGQAVSPLHLPPPLEKPLVSSDNYPRNPRAGKPLPRSLGRVPKRAATTRAYRDTSQARRSSGLHPPFRPTRTLSLDPLKFHPTNNNMKESISVPLSTVDRNVRSRVTEASKTPAIQEEGAGGEDINDKLLNMLAATDALKPSPKRANSSSSRFTRIVPSKVLAKVSNAWDRFHPKPPLQEKMPQTKGPVHNEEDGKLITRDGFNSPPSPNSMSPISTIEIRLNEGDNLNKRKVQRIVGGQVNRKPVAGDGKSLRNVKMDDPFTAEGAGWRTPTTFESRLKMGVGDGEKVILPLQRDPFETESEFDNNIEDRFLNSTPVGFSTPRIRVERTSTSSMEYSRTTTFDKLGQRQLKTNLGSAPSRSAQGDVLQKNCSRHAFVYPGREALLDSVAEARGIWEKSERDLNAFGSNIMKKHPSPSKEALENLEMAFRQYTHLKISGANRHDLDELAIGVMAASPSLKPYVKHRLSWNRLSTSNIDELVKPSGGEVHHRRGSSASMLQLVRKQNLVKLHKDIRLAPPYRPVSFSPHDVDELS